MIRTNKISFKEVIEAISKYAFSASNYPLILSLEVHCSVEQQNVMASLFKLIFSDSLIVSRNDSEHCLPSPESLKGKIILKGKVDATPSSSDSELMLGKNELRDDDKRTKLSISQLTHQIVYCKKIRFGGFPLQGNFYL
jgi:hypothetical protein